MSGDGMRLNEKALEAAMGSVEMPMWREREHLRALVTAYFDSLAEQGIVLVDVREVEACPVGRRCVRTCEYRSSCEAAAGVPGTGYEVSDRGLKYYEPIGTCYGHVVNVYESSSAGEPRIWLSFDAAEAVTDSPATALLSIEQVAALQATLAAAVANHYQQPFDDTGRKRGTGDHHG